jgi:hypothetical protein
MQSRFGCWSRLPWRNPIRRLLSQIRWDGTSIVWNDQQIAWDCNASCSPCTNCGAGTTPAYYDATVSSIIGASCSVQADGSTALTSLGDPNGTFRLNQTTGSGGCCRYTASVPGLNAGYDIYSALFDPTCAGTPTHQPGAENILLRICNTTAELLIGSAGTWFRNQISRTSGSSCNTTYSFTNEITTFADPTYSPRCLGKNGSVTLTPSTQLC